MTKFSVIFMNQVPRARGRLRCGPCASNKAHAKVALYDEICPRSLYKFPRGCWIEESCYTREANTPRQEEQRGRDRGGDRGLLNLEKSKVLCKLTGHLRAYVKTPHDQSDSPIWLQKPHSCLTVTDF